MRVLAIVGSPRKRGNTSILVQEALKPLESAGVSTELVYLADYDIQDCDGCEGCRETYRCTVEDDMQELYPLIMQADALILGSPAYFYNVSAHMKAFIDRCYCFEVFDEEDRAVWMGLPEALGGRYAAVIAVSEQSTREDMGFTAEAMQRSLQALGYRVVSTVEALGLFEAGAALHSDAALKQARQAGEILLRTLRLREQITERLQQTEL